MIIIIVLFCILWFFFIQDNIHITWAFLFVCWGLFWCFWLVFKTFEFFQSDSLWSVFNIQILPIHVVFNSETYLMNLLSKDNISIMAVVLTFCYMVFIVLEPIKILFLFIWAQIDYILFFIEFLFIRSNEQIQQSWSHLIRSVAGPKFRSQQLDSPSS
jgi:hypothetical protein